MGNLYTFQIRGWQFGDPARAIELAQAIKGLPADPTDEPDPP
jgi:hypothetical protein